MPLEAEDLANINIEAGTSPISWSALNPGQDFNSYVIHILMGVEHPDCAFLILVTYHLPLFQRIFERGEPQSVCCVRRQSKDDYRLSRLAIVHSVRPPPGIWPC